MKTKVLLSICFLVFSVCGFANPELGGSMKSPKTKIYVHPDQVSLHENQIWINMGPQGWVSVNHLASDADGFYISDNFWDPDDVLPFTWKCGSCGWSNSVKDSRCRNSNCPTNKK